MAHTPEEAYNIIEGQDIPFLFDDGKRWDLAATIQVPVNFSGSLEVFAHDVIDLNISDEKGIAFIYSEKNKVESISTIKEGTTQFYKIAPSQQTDTLEIWIETKLTNPVKKRANARLITDNEADKRRKAEGVTPQDEEEDEEDKKKFDNLIFYGGLTAVGVVALVAGLAFMKGLTSTLRAVKL